jgi:hypothetical protein
MMQAMTVSLHRQCAFRRARRKRSAGGPTGGARLRHAIASVATQQYPGRGNAIWPYSVGLLPETTHDPAS